MRRPKVLFFFTRSQLGGTEVAVSRLVANFDHKRFEVKVVSLEPSGPLHSLLSSYEIDVYPSVSQGLNPRSLVQSIDNLRRLVTTEKIDIIYTFGLTAELIALAARLPNSFPRLISGQRGGYAGRSLRGMLRGCIANACDFVVFNSQTARNDAIKYNFFTQERSYVIYNGIQPPEVLSSDIEIIDYVNALFSAHELRLSEERLVVTIANVHAPKDYSTLLQAARFVIDRLPNVRFLAIGRNDLNSTVFRDAVSLGIDDRFQFLGALPNAVTLEILNRCAIFVLSSRSEGMPNSILEAMMLRKPVVASAVGGVPELVKIGDTGLLFASGDALECAKHIECLLSDHLLAMRLGDAGYKRVQKLFSIERSVQATQDMFDKLLGGNRE